MGQGLGKLLGFLLSSSRVKIEQNCCFEQNFVETQSDCLETWQQWKRKAGCYLMEL